MKIQMMTRNTGFHSLLSAMLALGIVGGTMGVLASVNASGSLVQEDSTRTFPNRLHGNISFLSNGTMRIMSRDNHGNAVVTNYTESLAETRTIGFADGATLSVGADGEQRIQFADDGALHVVPADATITRDDTGSFAVSITGRDESQHSIYRADNTHFTMVRNTAGTIIRAVEGFTNGGVLTRQADGNGVFRFENGSTIDIAEDQAVSVNPEGKLHIASTDKGGYVNISTYDHHGKWNNVLRALTIASKEARKAW